jgi:integrase-like protein
MPYAVLFDGHVFLLAPAVSLLPLNPSNVGLYKFLKRFGAKLPRLHLKAKILRHLPVVIDVPSGHSKRRRKHRQPLRADIVELLRTWLLGRSGKLWPGSSWNTAAAMLKLDLKAAGIPYVDSAGRVFDFHSLWHQFISSMARAGVSPNVAQVLARHSTIVLTTDRYSHLHDDDATNALAELPAISTEKWTQKRTQTCVPEGQNLAQAVTTEECDRTPDPARKSFLDRYLSQPVVTCYGLSKEALVGVEPTMADLQSRSSLRPPFGYHYRSVKRLCAQWRM